MELFESHTNTFLRYTKGIDAIRRAQAGTVRARPELVVCIGRPGVGKTTFITSEIATSDGKLPDCHYQNDSQWWDGYTGQGTVVLDDFRGWIPLHTFLKLIDVVPIKLPIKGSFTPWFAAKKVYISSNFCPTDWWKDCPPEQYKAITRRISKLVIWDIDNEIQTYLREGEKSAWDVMVEEGDANLKQFQDYLKDMPISEPLLEPVV